MSTSHAIASTKLRTNEVPHEPRREPDAPPPPVTLEPATAPPPAAKRRKAPIIMAALIVVAGSIAAYLYLSRLGKESTDDAQIEGHVASVSARIPGQVARVLVDNDQTVQAGDVLVELDDADVAARLAATQADHAAATAGLHAAEIQLALTQKTVDANLAVARGGLAQATAVTGSNHATIEQAQADLGAAQSRAALARVERERSQRLVDTGASTRSELDGRIAAAEQADAAVTQAVARVAMAQANRSNSSGTALAAKGRMLAAQTGPEQIAAATAQVELAQARVAQAAAAVRQAELNLGYTKIRAERAGTIARKSVEPGQMVSPDRPLLALVDLDDVWVVANLKETQLAELKPGQRAEVEIDAYDTTLTGTVDSLQAGTGSRFSLLPPDNASGNFTKVTQRVPVRIRLGDRRGLVLRPGMSATVTIHTR